MRAPPLLRSSAPQLLITHTQNILPHPRPNPTLRYLLRSSFPMSTQMMYKIPTGTSGPMAARIALLRAQKQLYEDADVNIHVRNFAVRL